MRQAGNRVRAANLHIAAQLILGIYAFVLALTGFKDAWQLAFASEGSASFVEGMLETALSTPLSSLFAGVIITSLIQSSSATIALVVATVASGAITTGESVYLLMGANIGTTITNTIVGLAHVHQPEMFRRLLPAVIIDDVFKMLNVSLFFTLELLTGFLHEMSGATIEALEKLRFASSALHGFPDVIDLVTEPFGAAVVFALQGLPLTVGLQALLAGILFFALLILALGMMRGALDHYLKDTGRRVVQKVFGGSAQAFAIGFALCWLLQSSSVTVSLILPLVAHSGVTLPTVYYYSVGAALGTTCDAGQLLSYFKFGPVGLAAGLIHIYLNLFGALVFLFVPGVRRLPIILAGEIAGFMARYSNAPLLLLGYVAVLFFALPIAVIAALQVVAGA